MHRSRSLYSLSDKGLKLSVHVQPGAAKTSVSGLFNNKLKVRLKEKPTGGAANKALIGFLSRLFEIPKSSITILAGQTGREKTIFLSGKPEKLKMRISELISEDQDS